MSVFWIPIIAGVTIGRILGGRLANVGTLQLRFLPVLVMVAAVQIAVVFAPPISPAQGIDPMRVVLPLTTAAVGVVVLLNRRLPGMRLVLAGVVANLAVITANGGLMPISADSLRGAGMVTALELSQEYPGIRLAKSKDVVLPRDQTRLWWLSDVLVTPPIPRRKVVSLGDLLIGGGLGFLAARAMLGRVPAHGHARVQHTDDGANAGKERVRGVAAARPTPAIGELVA